MRRPPQIPQPRAPPATPVSPCATPDPPATLATPFPSGHSRLGPAPPPHVDPEVRQGFWPAQVTLEEHLNELARLADICGGERPGIGQPLRREVNRGKVAGLYADKERAEISGPGGGSLASEILVTFVEPEPHERLMHRCRGLCRAVQAAQVQGFLWRARGRQVTVPLPGRY